MSEQVDKQTKVLVIVGPTAVGKTALSIELAKTWNGEIISGDSMQVYQQLDVGTAKVTPEEQAGIPHHLIDCRTIAEQYSAADFQRAGRQLIAEISSRAHLPIVVGGTGLYIQALLYDFQLGGSTTVDPAIRRKYQTYYADHGSQQLWDLLNQQNSQLAATIHPNNVKRVLRALELAELQKQNHEPLLYTASSPPLLYDAKLIGLTTQRELLYQRINQRLDSMLEQGLLAEAELLYQHQSAQAAQGIGYKEFFPYFAQTASLAECLAKAKQQSRRYAKRQLTWFRNRLPAIQWYDLVTNPKAKQEINQTVTDWLRNSGEL